MRFEDAMRKSIPTKQGSKQFNITKQYCVFAIPNQLKSLLIVRREIYVCISEIVMI